MAKSISFIKRANQVPDAYYELVDQVTIPLSVTLWNADLVKNFLLQILQRLKFFFIIHFALVTSDLQKLREFNFAHPSGKNNYASVPQGLGWYSYIVLGDPISDHNQILMDTGPPSSWTPKKSQSEVQSFPRVCATVDLHNIWDGSVNVHIWGVSVEPEFFLGVWAELQEANLNFISTNIGLFDHSLHELLHLFKVFWRDGFWTIHQEDNVSFPILTVWREEGAGQSIYSESETINYTSPGRVWGDTYTTWKYL